MDQRHKIQFWRILFAMGGSFIGPLGSLINSSHLDLKYMRVGKFNIEFKPIDTLKVPIRIECNFLLYEIKLY